MRRIKKAEIRFISLVERGANQMPVIYKSDDNEDLGSLGLDCVTKSDTELGELTNIVYAVEKRDSQGDIADAAVVKDMCYDAARRGLDIDIRHDGKALGRDKVFVAENFIVQKGDPRFADWKDYQGHPVNAEGAWATVIKINDPALRQQARDGVFNGVSMAGRASVVVGKEDETPGWFRSFLAKLGLPTNPTDTTEDIPVDKQEFETILNEKLAELTKSLKPAEKTVEKKVEKTEPEVDMTDPVAVEKHLAELKTAELLKGVDMSDPKQVEGYLAKLKGDEGDEDVQKDDENPNADEIAALQKQIDELSGQSNQPGDSKPAPQVNASLSKEEAADVARGEAMAAFINSESAN